MHLTHEDLYLPVLKLISHGKQGRRSAAEALEDVVGLSEEEKAETLSKGMSRFEDRIGWAFTGLTKAECIERAEEYAVYQITDLGRDILGQVEKSGERLDVKYLENHTAFRKNWDEAFARKAAKRALKSDEEQEAESELSSAINVAEEDFDANLLSALKNLTWQEFEDVCAQLLEKMGYGIASKREIRVHDHGIDGVILQDELGLKGKIYLQAKRFDQGNVSGKDMREFLFNVSSASASAAGVFLTTSTFSSDAKDEAGHFSDKPIALIDKNELVRMCKKYQVLCKARQETFYELDGAASQSD